MFCLMQWPLRLKAFVWGEQQPSSSQGSPLSSYENRNWNITFTFLLVTWAALR